MADEKIRYVLDVDDKGTPKIVKFGTASEKAGKQADTAFSKAGKAFGEFGKQLPGVSSGLDKLANPAAAAGVAVTAAAAGFAAAMKKSIDFADGINDLSLRLGVSTERLSVLSLYADQSGTDIETLASAMGKLGVKMSTGDADLKKYGVTAGSVDEALFQLADKVKNTEDPMLRLKIATDAFGKSGQTMLPLLVQGGAALKEMSANAPIVSSEMAKMADEFNDKIAAMKGRLVGIGLNIAESILPELDKWADGVERIMTALGMVGDVQKRNAKIDEGRAKIIATYGSVIEKDAADRKRLGLGERTSGVRIQGMTLQEALGAYDRNNVKSTGSAPPPSMSGTFGAGAGGGKASPNSVDYWATNDLANYQYAYNAQRSANFALSGVGEEKPEVQNVDFGGMEGMAPDYYANLPLSDKAQASLEEQYDKAAAKEQEQLKARQEQMNSVVESMRSSMTTAFDAGFTDIWTNGRNVFASLYDAFSEEFTKKAISGLATLATNLIIPGAGGASRAGGFLGLLGFASGGNPPVGVPSRVGERREEAFIPQSAGRISPTSGSGTVINITVSNPAEARSVARQMERDTRTRNRGIR